MLILTRQAEESFYLSTSDGRIEVKIIEVITYWEGRELDSPRVKIGIVAPNKVNIARKELTNE